MARKAGRSVSSLRLPKDTNRGGCRQVTPWKGGDGRQRLPGAQFDPETRPGAKQGALSGAWGGAGRCHRRLDASEGHGTEMRQDADFFRCQSPTGMAVGCPWPLPGEGAPLGDRASVTSQEDVLRTETGQAGRP